MDMNMIPLGIRNIIHHIIRDSGNKIISVTPARFHPVGGASPSKAPPKKPLRIIVLNGQFSCMHWTLLHTEISR